MSSLDVASIYPFTHFIFFIAIKPSSMRMEKRMMMSTCQPVFTTLNVIVDAAAAVIILFLLLSSTSRLSSLLLLFNERDWNEVDTGYISMHLSIFNKWSVQFFDIFKIICSCRSFALSVYISPSHLSLYLLNVDRYLHKYALLCNNNNRTVISSHHHYHTATAEAA